MRAPADCIRSRCASTTRTNKPRRHMSRISTCRISGSRNLISVLSLGEQQLTGVFPRTSTLPIDSGPLELVWCPDSQLLQLSHSFDPSQMYGKDYGYRSSLNQSMVNHLTAKAT